ncbi:MAG: hypothetical protein IT467_09870 [Dokdonella sp.]|uniref:hypothetical protein n=1 Tax=Dokdonella sp. TaxID=2291710 RepID=UPI001ACC5749|nr:hypothetical protein [Dokdonella sp.]MBZ0222857.1 hypothetical protein [Dokdonella sp.]MCC7256219.1 hypothetical protein [Dokdonella sp.]CAG1770950.1 hypothetical protein BAC2_01388 [uncultured bacterium]
MRPISSLVFTCLLTLTATAGAQTTAPTLEERMSQAEFHAAGLDKLSPEELAQLNAWLSAHGGAVRYVTSGGAAVFDTDQGERNVIETSIDGSFLGWNGRTEFKLANGQRWAQSESGHFDAGRMDSPKVRIKPMMLGSWLMVVEGCGCSVRVRRVQ